MKRIYLRTACAVLITCMFFTTTVWGASLPIRYGGKNYQYTGKQLSFTYKGKSISLGKTPGIQRQKVNMLPYYIAIVKNGPKVKRSYSSKTGKLTLTYGKKKIVFYRNKKYAYTNGKKRKLTTAPFVVTYRNVNKSYLLIPANFTAKYLGIPYTYDSKKKVIHYAKPKPASTAAKPSATTSKPSATTSRPSSATTAAPAPPSNTGMTTTYSMDITRSAYIKEQMKIYAAYGGKAITEAQYDSYINPANDTTGGLQFLKLGVYRNVDASIYKNHLSSMIAGKPASVFAGRGDTFLQAAKAYSIDPLYFLCQTIQESGYGTSQLARGIQSSSLVDPTVMKYDTTSLKGKIVTGDSVKKDASGEITGFQFLTDSQRKSDRSYVKTSAGYLEITDLPAFQQNNTYYNLYGIKAVDAAPQLCGFTYAYNQGWTSVDKAINGAAKYVSKWYIHNSTYRQDTLYKFRYHPKVAYIWHQYATDPGYARSIGNLMYKYKNVYPGSSPLSYEKPVFR
nr:stalk domain-containing protein [uncultured Anaerostipes sp.]